MVWRKGSDGGGESVGPYQHDAIARREASDVAFCNPLFCVEQRSLTRSLCGPRGGVEQQHVIPPITLVSSPMRGSLPRIFLRRRFRSRSAMQNATTVLNVIQIQRWNDELKSRVLANWQARFGERDAGKAVCFSRWLAGSLLYICM